MSLNSGQTSVWNLAWRTGIVASASGMIPGLINSWETIHGGGRAEVPATIHLLAAVVHAEAYFIAGFLLALALALLLRRVQLSRWAFPVALGVPLVLFTALGITINVLYLPEFASPSSLAADALLLLLCVAGGWLLYRRLSCAERGAATMRPWLVLGGVVLFLAVLASLRERNAALGEVQLGDPEEALPDILFILVDTERADHLSLYGYPHPTTRWLESLAPQGVVFDAAVAASCHTKPSTASIFTSRYPPAHQARRLEETLPPSAYTMTQAFRAAGYRTAAFSANGLVSPTFGFGRGFERFYRQEAPYFMLLDLSEILYRVYIGVPVAGYAAGGVLGTFLGWEWLLMPSRRASDSLLQRAEDFEAAGLFRAVENWFDQVEGDGEHPLFTYVHLLEPHDPYEPPANLQKQYEELIGGHTSESYFPHYVGGFLPFTEGPAIDDEQRLGLVARYDAEIAAVDAEIGRFVERVGARRTQRDLLLVFTSDHGEEFYEHHGWGHGHSLYEETTHVPLLISYPGHLPAGLRIEERVSMIDLAPTLLELIGVPPPPAFQGTSLLPTIQGAGVDSRSPIFSEIFWGAHYARSYSEGSRKLIVATHGGEERTFLFDLERDPDELENLAAGEPIELAALRAKMQQVVEQSEAIAVQAQAVRIEGDIAEQMRALGYID
jgi:arylsulfatase A-like enzyme